MVEEEHERPSGSSRVSADTASGHQSVWKCVSVLWRVQYAAREPTTSWPVIVLGRCQRCFEASSHSSGRFSAGGGGEGEGSTGSTTTHLRTTHDRERLCARSGCGRKNDVRHDD